MDQVSDREAEQEEGVYQRRWGYLLIFLLTSCVQPDLNTGEGCLSYGIVEGEVSRMPATDIRRLSMDDIILVCGQEAWGCYHPLRHRIYLYWGAGKMDLNHELCHSIGLFEHA